jgi:hypothetical protein
MCIDPLVSSPTHCSPQDPSLRGACTELVEYCATFVTPPKDQAVADEYGVCVRDDTCLAAAGAGLVTCYDVEGQPVPP